MKNLMVKLITIVALVGSFSLLSAQTNYVYQTEKIMIEKKEAKIYIGTPVKIIGKDGDKKIKGRVEGFLFNNTIYSAKNKSLKLLELPKGVSLGKDGDFVTLKLSIDKGLLAKESKLVWEEHEEFYYEMCTQCHAAHHLEEHTMNEWSAIFETMKNFAQLYEDEASYLLRYLKANANDGISEEHK